MPTMKMNSRFASCSSPFRQAQGDPEPCRGVVVFVIIVIAVGTHLTTRNQSRRSATMGSTDIALRVGT
jgi:hypothetical protein